MVGHEAVVSVQAWKPAIDGIREVLWARFTEHAYPPHTHDAWTLFVVDDGAVVYDLDRRSRAALPDMVSILPPHVVHDGRPAVAGGYRKRVLYVETPVLGETLIGPAVDRPYRADPSLRRQVSALHESLRCADDVLEAETRFAFIAEQLRAELGAPALSVDRGRDAEVAESVRASLDRALLETPSIVAAATEAGVGPTTAARSFRSVFGIAPHAYVLGRRLDLARDRILAGQPLADVAAELGFYDQAHLTRRFKRFLGTTPGRFRRAE
jgi:AraC-like DNA-binding protein